MVNKITPSMEWTFRHYPYTKVTGCLYVCVSVPKDLANRWTDRVLLNRVASSGPGKVYNYFLGDRDTPNPPKNEKYSPLEKKFNFLTKIKNDGGNPPPQKNFHPPTYFIFFSFFF